MIWKTPSTYNALTFDLKTPCPFHLLFQKERKHPPCFFFFSSSSILYIWRRLLSLSAHTLIDRLTHPLLFLRSARDGDGRGKDTERESKRITRLSVPLAGGLYGWEWGVFSAPGFASSVPEEIPQNQPEGWKADHHRHGGAIPSGQAAHNPRVPHGEYYTTLYTHCICVFVCVCSLCVALASGHHDDVCYCA